MDALRALATALLLALPLYVAAAPFAVQVGESRIALDAPPGFADTCFTGSPRLQELAESLTSASNRVLLFALSDADLRRFTVGDQPELRRYMVAVTSRAAEREGMSESTFRALAGEMQRELKQLPPAGDYQKYLESQPPGAVSMLAELRKDAGTVSTYLLSSTSLVLLRGKALTLSIFTQYDDAADLEWIRLITLRWIDDLKKLNGR